METTHFARMIGKQAKKHTNREALCFRKNLTDEWIKHSWDEFNAQVDIVAGALLAAGVTPQQSIGQFSGNMSENLIIDFAAYSVRAVVVPMYATSSASQIDFIVNDAGIELLFVGEQTQYDVALEVLTNSKVLNRIIVLDASVVLKDNENSMYFSDFIKLGQNAEMPAKIEKLRSEAVESDLACILYTSGTTGNPKGVMMPHSCFIEAMRIHTMRLTSVTSTDVSLAFLPLSHVFERTWCYFCIFKGVTIYINYRPIEIQQTIKDVRPTLMCAVPRFWEKVYASVQENLSKMSPLMQGVVTWAVATGKSYNLDYLRNKKKPGVWLKVKYTIADKVIFSKVKKTIGIDNANMLPTAGARLSDEITVFMRSIGVPIIYGYGLTESTATVTCFDYTGYEVGTVGSIMPDVAVRIGDDSEILLKGKTIFPGYYKNPDANKAAFTADGWFRTGDAGYIKNNMIVLTERIKDLFKTSNGKYIAPQEIETRLGMDKYIEQVAVIGDERNYVTAIIVPAIPALEEYARLSGINFSNIDELLASEQIYKLVESRIAERQNGMATYEIIKKFRFIKKGFTMETGELTNTLKMRRAIIMQKYKSLIEEMYVS